MKKNKDEKTRATMAPGMDDQEELEQKASEGEIKRNDFTQVTTLSYDEVDQS